MRKLMISLAASAAQVTAHRSGRAAGTPHRTRCGLHRGEARPTRRTMPTASPSDTTQE